MRNGHAEVYDGHRYRRLHEVDITEVIVNPEGRMRVDPFRASHHDTGKTLEPEGTCQIIYQIADMKGTVCTLDPLCWKQNFLIRKHAVRRMAPLQYPPILPETDCRG